MHPKFSRMKCVDALSNQAPAEHEAREIEALRVNSLEEISKIDVEIKRMEGILDSLKRKRANFQKSVDNCNTILAPVRRLSMDVWGVIFTYCLVTHRNPIMGASEAPILLTQVCRDWRLNALSIPRLWSRLYIPRMQRTVEGRTECESLSSTRYGECRMEARFEEVQRWLRLSAACPLSITLTPHGGAPFTVSHQPLLDAIIQSCRRWQELELGLFITSAVSDVSKRVLSLSADDLCSLRKLRVHSTIHDDLWYQSGLFTAQGLRSISIGYMYSTKVFPTGIPPNWKNLNHLFIHSPTFFELAHKILNYCCNLVSCLLRINPTNTSIAAISNGSITLSSSFLPHLEFLSLQGHPAGCSQLFSNIEAPSLRTLDCCRDLPSENETSGLFNFLQSINSLETFMIDHRNLTGDDAVKCYTLFPSLTHLVLGQSSMPPYSNFSVYHGLYPEHVKLITSLYEIRHQYSPDSAPTVLLPSLEVFEAYGFPNITDTLLLEFIMARIDATRRSNTGVSKLRKVVVQFSRTRQMDIVPEALAYAQAAGIELELDLVYYTEPSNESWSPSYGLTAHDTTWTFPSYGY